MNKIIQKFGDYIYKKAEKTQEYLAYENHAHLTSHEIF